MLIKLPGNVTSQLRQTGVQYSVSGRGEILKKPKSQRYDRELDRLEPKLSIVWSEGIVL